jgi:hypothetical protein
MRSSAGQHLHANTQQPRSSRSTKTLATMPAVERNVLLTVPPFPCLQSTWPQPARMNWTTPLAHSYNIQYNVAITPITAIYIYIYIYIRVVTAIAAHRIHILQHVVANHRKICKPAAGSLSVQLKRNETVKWLRKRATWHASQNGVGAAVGRTRREQLGRLEEH